jgi:hypothetical protein
MELSANVRRAPLRLTTGAFVLNSGVTRFNADEQTSKRLQQTAAQWLPQVNRMDSRTFAKTVAAGEVALGTALMLPVVPAAIAGLGITAFAASLLAARGSAAGQHVGPTGVPTESTTPEPAVPKATEAWMLGSGVSLLLDALTAPAHDKSVEVSAKLHEKAAAKKRHLRRSRRRAAALSAVSSAQLGEKAHDASELIGERLQGAGERIVELRDEYQPVAAKKLKQTRKQARKKAQHFAEAARASAETAGERLQHAVPA